MHILEGTSTPQVTGQLMVFALCVEIKFWNTASKFIARNSSQMLEEYRNCKYFHLFSDISGLVKIVAEWSI